MSPEAPKPGRSDAVNLHKQTVINWFVLEHLSKPDALARFMDVGKNWIEEGLTKEDMEHINAVFCEFYPPDRAGGK